MEQVRETSAGSGRGDADPAAPVRPAWRPITPLDETRWSQILRLGQRGDTPEERRAWADAWDYLFATFRPALENQVRRVLRRNGFPEQECEDVVQDFWAKCLEKDWLTKADRQIGKFRTFAYVCVRRHCQRVIEARCAKRRDARATRSLGSMAEVLALPCDADDDEDFNRAWRRSVLDVAISRVAARSQENAAYLRVWVLGETDGHATSPSRAHRAKKMLQQELDSVVAASTACRTLALQESEQLELGMGRTRLKSAARPGQDGQRLAMGTNQSARREPTQ